MAELTTPDPSETGSGCCASSAQQMCCDPGEKSACCDASAAGDTCGCAAGQTIPTSADELRETVRERYAAAALATTDTTDTTVAAGRRADGALITAEQAELFGAGLYGGGDRDELPDSALLASLGCGNPIALAELHTRETVVDLGSAAASTYCSPLAAPARPASPTAWT